MSVNEVKGNAWELWSADSGYNVLCILTNGYVKGNGKAVMGAGIAKQAKKLAKVSLDIDLEERLGNQINANGNVVQPLWMNELACLLAFPTKHNWYEKSNLELIETSMVQLAKFADDNPNARILLPRPGCGNGKLLWEDVKPIIEKHTRENIFILTF